MVRAGSLAAWAAVVGCLAMVVIGLAVPARHTVIRWWSRVTAGLVVGSVVALGHAFWREDFSVVYVADHARRGVGAWDRISGVWGGMGGSLLLFGALLVVLGTIGSRSSRQMAAVGGIGGVVLAAALWLVDPFVTLDIPAIDGAGLTPILEHPAMRIHPPLVYLGLCVLVVPFAVAVAGPRDPGVSASVGEGSWPPKILGVSAAAGDRSQPENGDDWRRCRRWLVASWTLLGLGMVIGSWWAYAELGWGGYWAWDPVENTALVPWLAVTAALHLPSPRGPGPTRTLSRSQVVAAGAPFLFAVLGSVLTRSGATGSVHAFAEAVSVGRALLVLFSVLAAVLVVAVVRVPTGDAAATPWTIVTVGLLATVAAVVAMGTVTPALRSWFGGDRSLIAGTWFSTMLWPAVVGGLVVLAASATRHRDRRQMVWPVGGALLAASAAGLAAWPAPSIALAATAMAAGVAVAPTIRRPSGLAHLGVAVLLVGVAGTASGHDASGPFAVGEPFGVGGHEVELVAIDVEDGPVVDSSAVVATVDVDGHRLRPSLVAYPRRDVLLAETSVRSTPLVDVQVVLRHATDDGRAILDVHVNPLQQLVWWGGLLLVTAGTWTFAGSSRRSRSGDARRVPDAPEVPETAR